jgi:hypothetical protein
VVSALYCLEVELLQKKSILPPTEEISAVWRGQQEKKLFLIIVSVLGHPCNRRAS